MPPQKGSAALYCKKLLITIGDKMSITRRYILKTAVAAALLAASSLPAFAAEVAGVKFSEYVTVGGHEIKLNGADQAGL
jgi:hypothetical protein